MSEEDFDLLIRSIPNPPLSPSPVPDPLPAVGLAEAEAISFRDGARSYFQLLEAEVD